MMPYYDGAGGIRLHYSDEGEGAPILCLSGLTRNGSDFDYIAPHLSGARLIRLDYRGRGKSDWADPSTYTIPTEGQDALLLLDHLGITRTAILGTSRGGIIAMLLAVTAKDRLSGACLVDIGPELATEGLDVIRRYIGRNPAAQTYEEATAIRASLMPGFEDVPQDRWAEEVRKHYVETPKGLAITYDPRLREAVEAAGTQPAPDLWPMFDALADLPLAAIRGANSNLLSPETFERMRTRHPDMIAAEVPGRGHVPFLDEPEAIAAIQAWADSLP